MNKGARVLASKGVTLYVPRDVEARFLRHAKEGYPDEVCGFLVGLDEAEGFRRVHEARPASNAAEGTRRTRFRIPPREFLETEQSLEGTPRRVLGFYHSHPDLSAAPSNLDRDRAWPGYTYVVVSLRPQQEPQWKAWRLTEDGSRFVEEPIRSP